MELRKLLLKVDDSRAFVVVKDIFEAFPSLLRSGTWFEDGVKEIKRYGAIDPLFSDRIKAQPISIFGDNTVLGGVIWSATPKDVAALRNTSAQDA